MIERHPATLQEPSGLPEKEQFTRKICELLVYVDRRQPIGVLGEPGTVEIEARQIPLRFSRSIHASQAHPKSRRGS